MDITKYIFKPEGRTETEDRVHEGNSADAARHVVINAEAIRFLENPQVGCRAFIVAESETDGEKCISTSTLREANFNETEGILTLKTLNSVYSFRVIA